ncbi:MAG: hypothetical protein ACFFD5_12605 [Candidatus Thorarchaeota archaeon]
MDIAKFNKELATKIAIAKSLERSNEITAAIKLWLEISEMTVQFSKSRNLDFSFKNMLIRKTEGIVQHIKNLKSGNTIEDISVAKIEPQVEKTPDQEVIDSISSEESYNEDFLVDDEKINKEIEPQDVKFIENSEFKNLPAGFKEIQPKDDFKIITPHDNDYLEKVSKKDIDMSIFKPKEGENGQTQNQENIELEQPKDSNKVICFACGAELPAKTKICPDCGTIIK